jgi:hypothetical protein
LNDHALVAGIVEHAATGEVDDKSDSEALAFLQVSSRYLSDCDERCCDIADSVGGAEP